MVLVDTWGEKNVCIIELLLEMVFGHIYQQRLTNYANQPNLEPWQEVEDSNSFIVSNFPPVTHIHM